MLSCFWQAEPCRLVVAAVSALMILCNAYRHRKMKLCRAQEQAHKLRDGKE